MRLSKRYFKSVSSTKKGTRGGGQKKMHSSAIYKGYALYKIDGKKIHCNNRTRWGVHLPQMSFYYYSEICDLFFYCMVFLSMYTFLFCLYACLWDSVLFLCPAHIWLDIYVFFKLVVILMFSALLDTVKSNRKVRKESNSKERTGHEQDSQYDKHVVWKSLMGKTSERD